MLKFDKSKVLIMIVDDEPLNLRIIDSMLTMDNYRTLMLKDPADAEETAVLNQPDLILLDVSMPGISGFDICKRLKSNSMTSKIPVIFLSGQNSSEYVIKGLESGAQDYIAKPFSAPELLARVRTQIELKIMVEKMIEAEQIKALHAAMVSQNHNLNQLTTSILGQAEILELLIKKENVTSKFTESILEIEKAALGIDKIIKKFTKLSRIKYEKYSEKTDMLDLGESFDEED
ncbi:MAG: response regulator [Candidatus Delongbacteria bacterium]|jgi:DNA-binding response OmpR family regulator|nr:response regulator [Candidatus Delongbacteria bacterium]MDD4204944.1 response regulator [Candidatus Delongbacteria bacterium]MDY0018197.1 response regulator [Candidatus Delongbacteria bacterium]